jgi:DNA repair protein RadC
MQPEIVVGKIGNVTALKQLAPEVKVRLTRGKVVAKNKISSSEDAVSILKKFITRSKIETQEFAVAMFLNNNSNVLAVYQFGMGGITATVMDERLLMAAALKLGATGIILCHNHPSGQLRPSEADKTVTAKIVKIANLHNMQVVDHIIVTKDGYYSFAENGILR